MLALICASLAPKVHSERMVAIVLACNMFTVLSAVERKLALWLTCRKRNT